MTWEESAPIISGVFAVAVAIIGYVIDRASRRAAVQSEMSNRVRDEVRLKAVGYVESFIEKLEKLDLAITNWVWYLRQGLPTEEALKGILEARVALRRALFGASLYVDPTIVGRIATVLQVTETLDSKRTDETNRQIQELASDICRDARSRYFVYGGA